MAKTGHTLVSRQTKGKLPSLPFVRMKDAILGAGYDLSITFGTPGLLRELNRETRGKDYTTNILSFTLSKTSGEIVISLSKVRAGARGHGYDYENFLAFLVIHGMLHLKGYDHGSTMERQEERFKKMFAVSSLPS